MNVFRNTWTLMLSIAILFFAGCSTVSETVLPANDEVLIYELPYDLVYLRAMEALEKVDGWDLEETEKEKGVIIARNNNYGSFADADLRSVKILVTRINRNQTSVELAKDSQHVAGGGDLLESISSYVAREI